LQTNQTSTSLGFALATQPQPKEPCISLLYKFDNTHSKFQGFVNQVHLVIQFHLHHYSIGPAQVGLINTLLLGTTLVWFTFLLEHQSPLLNDFETFLEKFNATFGDSNKKHTSNIKQSLCQGSCIVAIYALEFRQLACDISWGDAHKSILVWVTR
jgi:hypothetical protein